MSSPPPCECEHGTTVDWGDLGRHQDLDDCDADDRRGPDGECLICWSRCEQCDTDTAKAAERLVGRLIGSVALRYGHGPGMATGTARAVLADLPSDELLAEIRRRGREDQ